jgi:hypothetical protein
MTAPIDGPTLGYNGGPPLEDEISEAASKKKRRGRPRRFPEVVEAWQGLGHPRSTQAAIDGIFHGVALSALGADEDAKLPADLAWLNGKVGILAQLGRLHFQTGDIETTRRIAAQLCEIKLKVKAAIAAVRRYRLGRDAVQRGDGLLVQLASCIDNYRSVRPSILVTDILTTIERLHVLVADMQAEETDRGGGR